MSLRGVVLEQLGRGAEASGLRRQRIKEGSRDTALFQDEARYLREAGKPEEALLLLDRATQLGIANEYTMSLRGVVLEQLGRGAEAS
jgi:Flp pilus assembly protein TadD